VTYAQITTKKFSRQGGRASEEEAVFDALAIDENKETTRAGNLGLRNSSPIGQLAAPLSVEAVFDV
jgi:hypothetical protein